MNKLRKFLLLTEVVICFSPVCLAVLSCSFIWFFVIYDWFNGEFRFNLMALVVLGAYLGLLGALDLVTKIIEPKRIVLSPKLMTTFLGAGFLAALLSASFLFSLDPLLAIFLVVFPVLSGGHLIYLGRNYVFHYSS